MIRLPVQVDPVYEEIERGSSLDSCPCRSHATHYGHNSSDMGSDEEGRRQNSDVSRQSSRSYGDNRPLIPHQTPAGSAPAGPGSGQPHADLLTTISCAFNSPHLPRNTKVANQMRSPHLAPPIHMGFDAAPHFDADQYAQRSQLVYDDGAIFAAGSANNTIPYTEC